MDVNEGTKHVENSVPPDGKGSAAVGWIVIACLAFVLYKGYNYFFVSEVDISKLAQKWTCVEISGDASKGEISNLQFDINGNFEMISFMKNTATTVNGNYHLTNNKIAIDNLFVAIQAPGLDNSASPSKFNFVGEITKLNADSLNLEWKLLGTKVTSPRLNYVECKKMAD